MRDGGILKSRIELPFGFDIGFREERALSLKTGGEASKSTKQNERKRLCRHSVEPGR
jgi:hypothetical protein